MQSVGEVMAIGAPSPSRCKRPSARSNRAANRASPTGEPPRVRGRRPRATLAQAVVATPERVFAARGGSGAARPRRRRRAHRHRPVVHRPAERDHRTRARARRPEVALEELGPRDWRATSVGILRPQIADLCGQRERRGRCDGASPSGRGVHAPSRRSTPARPSSRRHAVPLQRPTRTRSEVRPSDARPGDHPRLGPEPHRPGDRVRLLLRARLDGAARHGATRP
jgi:hypothetical protein